MLIEDLVSHGYVVASIEHTYTVKAVWFPDGAMVPVAKLPIDGDDRKILEPLCFLEAFLPESNMGGAPDQISEYQRIHWLACCNESAVSGPFGAAREAPHHEQNG
jgi:hypothetical protein